MSIFTTMRAGVSVLPPPASRLPTVDGGGSNGFSSLVNGRMPAPTDGQPARLSIYSAMSAETLGRLTNGLSNGTGDVGNGLPAGGGDVGNELVGDGDVTGGPAGDVTNALPFAGAADGQTSDDDVGGGDLSNGLPKIDLLNREIGSPISEIGEGTVTNELPRVDV
jgi:hypothetical protein